MLLGDRWKAMVRSSAAHDSDVIDWTVSEACGRQPGALNRDTDTVAENTQRQRLGTDDEPGVSFDDG